MRFEGLSGMVLAAALLIGSICVSGGDVAASAAGAKVPPSYELIPLDRGTWPAGDLVISRHGRFVAMTLVSAARHTHKQVVVWDQRNRSLVLVSEAMGGGPGDGRSVVCDISQNGRFVLFNSKATNLVAQDTNSAPDTFVRDLRTGTTQRVSLSSHGEQLTGPSHGGSLTADGGIAFFSTTSRAVLEDHNAHRDVYARDLLTGRVSLVSRNSHGRAANAASSSPFTSDNGRWVAFRSYATNLARADRDDDLDVYLRDRKTGQTRLVSKTSVGAPIGRVGGVGGISGDGQVVAFNAFTRTAGGKVFHPWLYRYGSGHRQDLMARYPEADGYGSLNSQHGNLLTIATNASLTHRDNTTRHEDVYAMQVLTGDLTLLTRHDPPIGHPLGSGRLSRDGRLLAFVAGGHYSSADTDRRFDAYLRDVPNL